MFHQNYVNTSEKTMLDYDKNQYELIFDIFDDNSSGLLDFREFLSCLSVLMRGTFAQKLDLFYDVFGAKQHKNLSFT